MLFSPIELEIPVANWSDSQEQKKTKHFFRTFHRMSHFVSDNYIMNLDERKEYLTINMVNVKRSGRLNKSLITTWSLQCVGPFFACCSIFVFHHQMNPAFLSSLSVGHFIKILSNE